MKAEHPPEIPDASGHCLTDCAYTLSREQVESRNIASVMRTLYAATTQWNMEGFLSKSWDISFSYCADFRITGYEHDPRKLTEIHEIKTFFSALVEELLRKGVNTLPLVLSMLCREHITSIPHRYGFDLVTEDEMVSTISDLINPLSVDKQIIFCTHSNVSKNGLNFAAAI